MNDFHPGNPTAVRASSNIMEFVGSWTGRSLPALSGAGRGKSELLRAVCRITSGKSCSSATDGKCHRKHTAPLASRFCYRKAMRSGTSGVRVKRCGKSVPLLQQCDRQGKPHTEQDQIGREARVQSQTLAAHRPDAIRRLEQWPKPPGRSLMSVRGNAAPRGMTAHDRIRLTGPFAECTIGPDGKLRRGRPF